MAKKIRVGFDMDGVLLYNPLRTGRPIISFIKKYFLKRKTTKFYLPKPGLETFVWTVIHKSSMFMADGVEKIKSMIRENKIEAYIVTGRYSSLKGDVDYWFNKINKENLFHQCFYNDGNEQPHAYKERMIEKLDLEYFVEDNWDIVSHLNNYIQKTKRKTKVLWITNLLDMHITYPYKFTSLKKAVEYIQQNSK